LSGIRIEFELIGRRHSEPFQVNVRAFVSGKSDESDFTGLLRRDKGVNLLFGRLLRATIALGHRLP
jgi:hypothetical protein